jgi:hypothetical protein
MNLEDLNFLIKIDFDGALADIPKIDAGLSSIKAEVAGINAAGNLAGLQSAMSAIKSETAGIQFNLEALTKTLTTAAVAAQPLAAISGKMSILSSTFGLAATGAHHLAAAAGLVTTLLKTVAVGVNMVLWPLQGLVLIPKLIAGAFSLMFSVVMAPFKLLIGLVGILFKGLMAVVAPVLKVAEAFFRFKLFVGGLALQIKLLTKFIQILPPQLRLVFAGLVALGVAGRAGSAAIKAAVVAISAFKFGLMALTNPLAAAKTGTLFLAQSMLRLTTAAGRATVALGRMAIQSVVGGMRSLASATVSVAAKMGSLFVSAVKTGGLALLAAGAAAVAWGVKTAIAVETSAVVFGTMLKDMRQGAALMQTMNKWSGAPLFDNKALQDAGRFLLKSGVAATDVTSKLDQFGNMAIATKTPIEDLTRIYQRGMTVGKFGTGLINDMAERGIDIWHGLSAAVGKSVPEVQAMAAAGQIGAAEMNAAIEGLTTGTGIYAGAIANVSQTTEGLLSRIANNIQMAFTALVTTGVDGMKPLLTSVADFTSSMITKFAEMAPVVNLAFGTVTAWITTSFNLWSQAASKTMNFIFEEGTLTFQNMLQGAAGFFGAATWYFENFGTVAEYAFKRMQLFGVIAFNEIGHFLGVVLPEYLGWFADNWKGIFFTLLDFSQTVFINLGINIRNAMTEIWDYIASGGANKMEFAFTPLLDGFKNTIAEMPTIAAREMSNLESQLLTDTEAIGAQIGEGMGQAIADAQASLVLPESLQLAPGNVSPDAVGGEGTGEQKRTNFAVGSLERGSEAALNAVYAAQNRDKTPQQHLTEAKKQTALLTKLVNQPSPPVQMAVS